MPKGIPNGRKTKAKFRKVNVDRLPNTLRMKFNAMQEVYKKYHSMRHDFEDDALGYYASKLDDGLTIKFGYYWGTLSIAVVPKGPAPRLSQAPMSIEDVLDDLYYDRLREDEAEGHNVVKKA